MKMELKLSALVLFSVIVITACGGGGGGGASPVTANPASVTVDPSGQFVYTANWGSNNISVYAIDATTGALTAKTVVAAGTNPVSIAVDPSGKFAYAANWGSNNISVYSIAADGALTPVGTAVAAGTNPYSVAVAPSTVNPLLGKFVYAANLSSNNISVYTIAADGALALTAVTVAMAGTNPASVAVDPSGQFVYAANNGSSSISVYTIAPANGALTAGTAVAAGMNPVSVAVAPSAVNPLLGKFVYAANWTSNNISVYTINPANGALAAVGLPVDAGTNPHSIAVDPSGKFVYAANWTSNNISVYTINAATGELTAALPPVVAAGTNPVSIAVAPSTGDPLLGKFVYAANETDSTISVYKINATTGALQLQ